jgi:hypothetical protein
MRSHHHCSGGEGERAGVEVVAAKVVCIAVYTVGQWMLKDTVWMYICMKTVLKDRTALTMKPHRAAHPARQQQACPDLCVSKNVVYALPFFRRLPYIYIY